VLNGYDTAKWVAVNYPDVKILILTTFDTEAARSIAFCKGAHAFSSKNIDPQEMEDILNQLTASAIISESSTLNPDITEKEQVFLKGICTDKTYEEIADCMNISLRQVERIRENLFEKLKVNSRTSLAVFAIKNGVVTS
jgi:DNA-binding NarL/FixJ family response regulator